MSIKFSGITVFSPAQSELLAKRTERSDHPDPDPAFDHYVRKLVGDDSIKDSFDYSLENAGDGRTAVFTNTGAPDLDTLLGRVRGWFRGNTTASETALGAAADRFSAQGIKEADERVVYAPDQPEPQELVIEKPVKEAPPVANQAVVADKPATEGEPVKKKRAYRKKAAVEPTAGQVVAGATATDESAPKPVEKKRGGGRKRKEVPPQDAA